MSRIETKFNDYSAKLNSTLNSINHDSLSDIVNLLLAAKETGANVFLCGNGGSAGNSMHIANDFIYGARGKDGKGFNVHALPSNSSVITCLANDEGYDRIYSEQLKVLSSEGDVLIVLSGSGNSPNILSALREANSIGLETVAVLGYDGGAAKSIAKHVLHFAVNDMQISEDIQLIVFHIIMQVVSE